MTFGRHEVVDVFQQGRMTARTHFGIAEFAHFAILDFAAQLRCHRLHAVADTQHGHTQIEDGLWRARRIALSHRTGATGQNNAGGTGGADEFIADIIRMDFGEHTRFTYATCDQLRDLGTEIKDKNLGVHERTL